MQKKTEISDDELEELLDLHARDQPAECRIKPVHRHMRIDKKNLKPEKAN